MDWNQDHCVLAKVQKSNTSSTTTRILTGNFWMMLHTPISCIATTNCVKVIFSCKKGKTHLEELVPDTLATKAEWVVIMGNFMTLKRPFQGLQLCCLHCLHLLFPSCNL